MFLDIGTLLLLFVVPGWAAWLAWGRQAQPTADWEPLLVIIAASVSLVSLPALLLAEFGFFSLPRLLLLVGVITLALVGWGVYRHGRTPLLPPLRIAPLSLLALLLLLPLIWQGQRPFSYIVGGRDHGIYVNTGVHIARTGGILIDDPELAALPAESRELLVNTAVSIERHGLPGPWSEGQRMPGLTIRSLEDGVVLPQGFHLYPVWIAIFYGVGGLDMALATTAVFGVLGALAIYVAGARLWGRPAALIGLLFLVGSVTQGWFVRYPSAEILLQFLFWIGLLAFTLMLQTDDRFMAIVAAGSLGLMHLTKLDTVVIPVAVLMLLLYLWLMDRFPRSARYFLPIYGLLLLHTLLHAYFIATTYFIDQATRELLPGFLAGRVVDAAAGYTQPGIILSRLWASSGWLALAALGGAGAGWAALVRLRPRLGQWLKRLDAYRTIGKGLVLGALALGVGITAVAIFLNRSDMLNGAHQSFLYMSWYLTPFGFILGLVGAFQLMSAGQTRGPSAAAVAAWLLLASTILPLFLLGGGTAWDHIWAVRRYLTVVVPFLYLCLGYVLWELVPRQREQWYRAWLPLGLGAVLLVGTWQQTRPFINFVEYDTLPQQLETWADTFPDEAVILLEQSDLGGRLALPLWFIHDKTVFLPPSDNMAALAPALTQWAANGRPVFWISTQGATPPQPDGWAVAYETTRTIAVPFAETPRDRPPAHTGEYVFTLDVHRVMQDTAMAEPRQVTTLANTENTISGVYAPTPLRGLDARAWTSGQVTAVASAPTTVAQIALMAGNGRPGDIPQPEIEVTVNGRYLQTVQVTQPREMIVIDLPAAVQTDTIEIQLTTAPWNPFATGYNQDRRDLGFLLDWIKIVSIQDDAD